MRPLRFSEPRKRLAFRIGDSRPLRQHFAITTVAAALLVAGLVVPAATRPALQLTGNAPPPPAPLNLWYRAPASDHALDPARPGGPGASAEWVRALPVGNGRLGAMIFGGVVHERLQLNEATLWAGRPYDPVNPDAKAALPQVRQLLAEGRYTDAAQLVSQQVMAKPLAQMPYQTLGDLTLTFPQTDTIEDYRRDLDLTTATAHVSYLSRGVKFEREVFASAPEPGNGPDASVTGDRSPQSSGEAGTSGS
jgi:alpha-L-fucosidase 2